MIKVALVTVALTGAIAFALDLPNLPENAPFALTTFDQVPTKPQLDTALGSGSSAEALDNLTNIATTESSDPNWKSYRLRAIHALAKYCPTTPCGANDVAHEAVTSVITETQSATTGYEVLLLRASIETLGAMKVSSDASVLIPLLAHPSRDIRAATARALRDLCNNQAVPPLRARYSVEMTDQVKLAISEALRILGQCSNL